MIDGSTLVTVNDHIVSAQFAYSYTYTEFPIILMYDNAGKRVLSKRVEEAIERSVFETPAVEILTDMGRMCVISPGKVFLSQSKIGAMQPIDPKNVDPGKRYWVLGLREGRNVPERFEIYKLWKRENVLRGYWIKSNDSSLLLWASGVLVRER